MSCRPHNLSLDISSLECPARCKPDLDRSDILLVLLIAIVFATMGMVWFSFDQRIPTQDEAKHILNSIACSDLLARGRPWQYHWWYQCLNVSEFYPPFIYLVNGIFLLFFGKTRLIEQLCATFFTAFLLVGIYVLIRQLRGGKIAGCASALFLCSYPLISRLSHTYFLDLPAVAMMTCALAALIWSRNEPAAKFPVVLTGFLIGAAFLSKPLVIGYLLAAVLYILILDLKRGSISRAASIIAIAFAVAVPFYWHNLEMYQRWQSANIDSFASVGIHHSLLSNLVAYLEALPTFMSPVLFSVFAISFLFFRLEDYRKLFPLICSMLGGFILTSNSMGIDLEMRYFVPFFVGPAVFSGFLIEKLFKSTKAILRFAGAVLLAIAVCTYVSFNFAPYPVPLSPLPGASGLAKRFDGNPKRDGYEDWGYPLVLEKINSVEAGKAVYLNILPNHDALHTTAFALFLKEHGNDSIFPTNSRTCTIVGDRVVFNPTTACYPSWYLRKTGDNGFHLADQQSEIAYGKLIDFIANSGKFKLAATKRLPDGSDMLLYRKAM